MDGVGKFLEEKSRENETDISEEVTKYIYSGIKREMEKNDNVPKVEEEPKEPNSITREKIENELSSMEKSEEIREQDGK